MNCPVCGSPRTRVHLAGGEHIRMDVGSSRTTITIGDVWRCRECGFGFSGVRATEGRLAELYREMDTAVYEAEAAGRLRTARGHLRILSRQWGTRPGRLLEIGCASGEFLMLASEAGWEAVGVEPSAALSAAAQRRLAGRARVIPATLQTADLAGEQFDAAAMFDVLEHVPDPVAFLRLVVSLLAPDGLLLMNVPDLDSIPARVFGGHWPLLLPEHLSYFNKGSLRRVAAGAALRLVAWGRRPAWFSVGYVLYRLAQHGIPGATWLGRCCGPVVGDVVLPVWMGELWSAWRN